MLNTEQAHSQITSLGKKKSELESEMNAKDDIVAKSQVPDSHTASLDST